MTEAGWTREKPIAAGWYWWRSLNGMIGPEIIQIDNTNGPDTDLEVIGPFGETPLDEWIAESEDEPGEWQGPLSPDTYAQGRVAGLREAEDYAERCVKERQLQLLNLGDQAALDPNDRRPGWIRCKASEARRIQVWCARQTQQAQAAQDEKGVGDGQQ